MVIKAAADGARNESHRFKSRYKRTHAGFSRIRKPQLTTVATYEKDGYRETLIRMYSHVGTHIDPPAHVYEKGLTLDALPLTQFIGQALVIDCRHRKSENL